MTEMASFIGKNAENAENGLLSQVTRKIFLTEWVQARGARLLRNDPTPTAQVSNDK